MRLKVVRTERGVLQSDLAKMCGIDVGALSKMENGQLLPTPNGADALASALGCTVNDILTRQEVAFHFEREKRAPSYRACFRLPTDSHVRLREAVKAAGYGSLQAWFDACVGILFEGVKK